MHDPLNTALPSYQVRYHEAEEAMRNLARSIKKTMPEGFGFAVFLFRYAASEADRGELFYMSSAKHEDMLAMLKEFIAKQEQS